jgi:hypothetical protein
MISRILETILMAIDPIAQSIAASAVSQSPSVTDRAIRVAMPATPAAMPLTILVARASPDADR